MTYDDFLFYLPGYASIPIAVAGMLVGWLVWRAIRGRKPAEKPKEPDVPKPS